MWAAYRGHTACMEVLLDAVASEDKFRLLSVMDQSARTALSLSVLVGHSQAMVLLLQHGADSQLLLPMSYSNKDSVQQAIARSPELLEAFNIWLQVPQEIIVIRSYYLWRVFRSSS